MKRPCYIHTLEGKLEATACRINDKLWRVASGQVIIVVNDAIVSRKFAEEEKPTFMGV